MDFQPLWQLSHTLEVMAALESTATLVAPAGQQWGVTAMLGLVAIGTRELKLGKVRADRGQVHLVEESC